MDYKISDRMLSLKPSAIREILKATADPAIIPFAAGNPAPNAFPVEEIAKITADVFATDPILTLQYSVSEGYTPLRQTISQWMKKDYNIGRDFDELLVMSGATQGIEIACKVLCNEGDVVICENPSFVGSLNAFRSYKTQLVGVDVDADGINIEKLEKALQENPRAKIIYLIPNFQNPTGITMSFEKRKAVYALAKQFGVMIVEDNPYGDLRFTGEPIPSIKSLDEDGLVIYCGSFSKIIAPGIRVAYIIAPAPVISKMTVAKQCSDVHTNILAQLICYKFLTEYDIHAHLEKIRGIYRDKCALMLRCLDEKIGSKLEHTTPEGGLFIWCTLPKEIDMLQFVKKGVEKKVAVVPGTAFLADESAYTNSFRMNFSTPTDENIVKGVDLLAQIL